MMGAVYKRPELLAPAGSLDVFITAVEEGADAVYVGAPALNARALARHFTMEELAAMIDYGHKNGVKVYLAMNSLLKEDEIPQLVELLALLESISPDALIIQDLGLYYLVKKYFPSFTLHASTLMGAHNSLAVQQFSDMGFKRVVLAREVTLEETRKIHKACPVELEVFVHGALCFSYSGLCLFSSFQGGKISLRGRCVQPCRRRYSWTGAGRGQNAGYFFSMNDLEAIRMLPELARAGVVSFKIEGRMRSANYVGSVVRAYRKMIDAGSEAESVLPEVQELLYQAMGRKATAGYFSTPQPEDAITPFHSGNIGHFIGKVISSTGDHVVVTLQEGVEPGDRVRHHHEKTGDRRSFTLKGIRQNSEPVLLGTQGKTVSLCLPGVKADVGDALYKVDVKKRRVMESKKNVLEPKRFRKLIEKAEKKGVAAIVLKKLTVRPHPVERRGTKVRSAKNRKGQRGRQESSQPLPIWLRGSDLRLLSQSVVEQPERLMISLDHETMKQIRQQKKSQQRLLKSVTWVLPPVILEHDVDFYQKAVWDLLQQGCRQWMVSHVGQLQLFQGYSKKRGGGGIPPAGKPFILADYTLNVLNSAALQFLQERGVHAVELCIEADRDSLKNVCQKKRKSQVGLTVYSRPPLFTARLHPDFFHFNKTFISPRGERFELVQKWGQTLALPEKPFSLMSELGELKNLGIDFAVVDLSFTPLHRKAMTALRKSLFSRAKGRAQSSFNFFRSLQ